MRITCPSCNYSKDIDPAILPPDVSTATCPKCKESFSLPGLEPEAAGSPQTASTDPRTDADFTQPTAPVTGQTNVDELPKAGFWIRVVASFLDGIILFVVQFILGALLAMAGFAAGNGGSDELSSLVMLFSYIISFAYYIIFTGHCGQTPGKMAVRIKVIHTDGSDIGYGKATFREVIGKFISGIILCIGYLMVAFDSQKQGLHDRMADTYVIKL